jgi:hypothetical protein
MGLDEKAYEFDLPNRGILEHTLKLNPPSKPQEPPSHSSH